MKLSLVIFLSLLALAVAAGFREGRSGNILRATSGALVPLAAIIGLMFGFVLSVKWTTPLTSDVMLGGLMPVSDAIGYFHGSLTFLQSGHLTEWATRRPATSLELAGLMGFGGGSLRFSVIFLTGLAAAGSALAIVPIARRYGLSAALTAYALLFAFFYPTIGTVMSENIGFALGAAGFVLMWGGTGSGRPWQFAAGLLLCAIALMARAGAMLVIPALVVYAGWRFRAEKRFSVFWLTVTGIAALMAFAFNTLLVSLWGQPGTPAFSNFSYTLYGLAVRGEEWTRFFRDFPAIAALPESEQAKEAYRLAVAHIRAHPLDLLAGIAHRYNDFFINTRWFAFDGISSARVIFVIPALSGIWRVYRMRREPIESFIGAGIIGIWLSAPFIGDGGTRVHAATVAFSAALVAIGVHAMLARYLKPAPSSPAPASQLTAVAGFFAVLALAPLLAAPAYRGQASHGQTAAPGACPPGAAKVELVTTPNTYLDVVPAQDKRAMPGWPITPEALAAGRIWPISESREILAMGAPLRVSLALLKEKGEIAWLVSAAGRPLPQRLAACSKRNGDFQFYVPAKLEGVTGVRGQTGP